MLGFRNRCSPKRLALRRGPSTGPDSPSPACLGAWRPGQEDPHPRSFRSVSVRVFCDWHTGGLELRGGKQQKLLFHRVAGRSVKSGGEAAFPPQGSLLLPPAPQGCPDSSARGHDSSSSSLSLLRVSLVRTLVTGFRLHLDNPG